MENELLLRLYVCLGEYGADRSLIKSIGDEKGSAGSSGWGTVGCALGPVLGAKWVRVSKDMTTL